MKNIYLEPEEEIISIIDRLVQTKDQKINLIVPSGAQIWQSSINLKLLKRESDNLNKEIVLIVSDDIGAEMAEKIGFVVKREKEFPVELVNQEQGDEEAHLEESKELEEPEEEAEEEPEEEQEEGSKDMIDVLVKELASDREVDEKEFLRKNKKLDSGKKSNISLASALYKKTRKRMDDIVNPKDGVKVNFFRQQFLKKGSPVKIKKKLIFEEASKPRPVLEDSSNEVKFVNTSSGSRWSKFLIIFVILALIVTASVAYLALPNAKITVFPKIEQMNFDLPIVGSKAVSQIDQVLNIIPLQEIEVKKTKSREFVSTGEKELNEKARGSIRIYNEYSSSPQTLVATTRFESSSGKIFRIIENVTVPGAKIEEGKIMASSIEVEVFADQAGADYNIAPSNFTIPGFRGTAKFAGFYAKSKAAMTAGSVEKVRVVLAEDLQKAEDSLIEELKRETEQSIQEQIPDNLKIVQGGLEQEITVLSTVDQGTVTDKFTVEIEVAIRALVFNEEELKELIDLNLVSRISGNKVPLSETQQIEWREPTIDWVEKKAFFNLGIQENIAWQIDVQALKQDIVGLNEIEVRKYFRDNRPDISNTKIDLWPFWIKKIPNQEEKIDLIIDTSL